MMLELIHRLSILILVTGLFPGYVTTVGKERKSHQSHSSFAPATAL